MPCAHCVPVVWLLLQGQTYADNAQPGSGPTLAQTYLGELSVSHVPLVNSRQSKVRWDLFRKPVSRAQSAASPVYRVQAHARGAELVDTPT